MFNKIARFLLGMFYEVERKYYKNEASWGLALSGGGTRSASFNIGVLAGLNSIRKTR